jgi:tetratricopeptide (TPR) repeat protein
MTIKQCVYPKPIFGVEEEEIIENCKKAIEIEPNNYEAYYWWGSELWDDGKEQLTKAIDICTKIINNNPQDVHALYHRAKARSMIAICDDDEIMLINAIDDYSRVIEIDPLNIEAYNGRAWVQNCSSYGNSSEAIKDYSKIIELDPENMNAYHNRAELKIYIDNSGAIEDFTRIIEIDANNDEAYVNRGETKEKISDFEGAKQDYLKAIEIKPVSCYYWGLCKFYYNRKEYDQAIEYFDKANELFPSYEEVVDYCSPENKDMFNELKNHKRNKTK